MVSYQLIYVMHFLIVQLIILFLFLGNFFKNIFHLFIQSFNHSSLSCPTWWAVVRGVAVSKPSMFFDYPINIALLHFGDKKKEPALAIQSLINH